MWKYRCLTRILPWNQASKSHQGQRNPISWTLCQSFSAVGTTFSSTPGFVGTHSSVLPRPGSIYGKLSGVARHTLKMDIVHFFEGCGLKPEDIKLVYSRNYLPNGMILQFPTRAAYATALRLIAVKGRYYRLQEVDSAQWSIMPSFDGKLLLSGIPRNALQDDVERFLSGYSIDGSSVQFFARPGLDEPVRCALVSFCTARDAANALREKNRSFCLNNPITLRLLQ